ncbi:MAG: hypothetical protein M1322_01240 [Candidatus Parvarchaeota archaeon]|jgi:hypothetical protein|nr:hypothetical protein [Candidatus Parvarchaeota archaeon]MCL5106729.1 hypothetical protein [Candidatus Parvarchaeota archaeon]
MEKLENLLNKLCTAGKYYALPATGIQAEINRVNYQTDLLFLGLAVTVSIAAGYSVYKYLKSIKRGY